MSTKLDPKKVIDRTMEILAEDYPGSELRSRQVKSAIKAIVEEINKLPQPPSILGPGYRP